MSIEENIPLSRHTTFRLGGPARYFAVAKTEDELVQLISYATEQGLAYVVIGGGSNIIGRDEGFDGLVIQMGITGFEVEEDTDESCTITLGAGENWDDVVARTVGMNLSGIEAMSGIPGTVGGTPVQNVGAYGQEISDTLVRLLAYDTLKHRYVWLNNQDCHFSYRESIFRSEQSGRYCIARVTLKLSKQLPHPPFYESLQTYLDSQEITDYTPSAIRAAVLSIRKEKLPPVAQVASAGSFFKNAIVEASQLAHLRETFPDIPSYALKDGRFKVPSGWLIDTAQLKGYTSHGIRVYEKNALVLVNESATHYSQLAQTRQEIIDRIKAMFDIVLEQEPLEL